MEDTEEKSAGEKAGTAIDLIGKGGNAALAIIGGVTKAVKENKGGFDYKGVNIAAKPKALDFGQLAGWKQFKSKNYYVRRLKKLAGKEWGFKFEWWFEFEYGGYAKGAPHSLYVRDFRIEIDKASVVCTYGWFCNLKTSLKEPPQNVGSHEAVIAQAALQVDMEYGHKIRKKEKWGYNKVLYAQGDGKWRTG